MSAYEGRHEQLVRYLLGDVTPEEQESVEEAYVSEGGAFLELLAAEEDLIDAYVAGDLPAADRKRFEEHFLASPARRERVAFARALAGQAAPGEGAAPRRTRRPEWLPLAALLAGVVLAGAWLAGRVRTLDEGIRRADAARESALQQGRESERRAVELEERQARLLEELGTARAERAGAVAAWVLAAGIERGSGARAFEVPSGTEWVRLQLRLEDDSHPLYEVVVETADGQAVARSSRLRPRTAAAGGRVAEVMLPAASLQAGTYVVSLKGTTARGLEVVGDYHLRVVPGR